MTLPSINMVIDSWMEMLFTTTPEYSAHSPVER
jgi:hypothetical protein